MCCENECIDLSKAVCCYQEICEGLCYRGDILKGYSHCISQHQVDLCVNGAKFYPIAMASLMAPTVITWLISCCSPRRRPHACVFIGNLLLNMLWGVIIITAQCVQTHISFYLPIMLVSAIATFMMTLCFVAGVTACCGGVERNGIIVRKELKADIVSKERYMDIILHNKTIPPNLTLVGEAFHIRKTKNSTRRIVTKTVTEDVPFESWEENGPPTLWVPSKCMVYHGTFEIKCEDSVNPMLEEYTEMVGGQVRGEDNHYEVLQRFTVNDFVSESKYVENQTMACCSSKPMRVFYYFLFFIGYNSIYETVWLWNTTSMFGYSTKRVSGEKSEFRVGMNEIDHEAGKQAIDYGTDDVIEA